MLIKNRTYRCASMLDVDIHVLAIKYIGKDYIKMRVCFPYRHNPDMVIMDAQIHKVPFAAIKKWTLL